MSPPDYPIHQTTVAKMEGGTRPTTVGELAAIAALFDTSIGALFEHSEDARDHQILAALLAKVVAISDEILTLKQRELTLLGERDAAAKEYIDHLEHLQLRGSPLYDDSAGAVEAVTRLIQRDSGETEIQLSDDDRMRLG